MSSQTSLPEKRDFNASLNGYRGFCALLVFGFHLGSAGVVARPHGSWLENGVAELWTSLAYGVEMFFMISGFVILGSLLRHATLRGFLEDRFVRIYSAWIPALIAVTAVCVVLRMKMFAGVSVAGGLGIFIANLFLLPPLLPLPLVHQGSWSLSYEWVFYLSAVAGLWLVRRRASQSWPVGVWIAASALFVCLYPRSLFFLTGVIVFSGRSWFRRHERWLQGPLASLLIFLIAWRMTGADSSSLGDTLFTWIGNGQWLAAMVAFLASLHLFASITLDASRQCAFLKSRAFQFLGTISYSFYLWHALIMSATKRAASVYVVPRYGVPAGFLFFLVSSLALGLLVSWASWSLFEVRLARWLRKRLAPIPVAAPHLPPPGSAPNGHRLRCLWIARYIPYPLDAGAKVYSAKLAESLAQAGAMVRFLGFGDVRAVPEPGAVEWREVPGHRRSYAAAAFSSLPVAAAIDATRGYRTLLESQLSERWDAIVFDGYGSGWALNRCLAHRSEAGSPPAVLVHVSHNHEANLWQLMAGESRGSTLKRLALRSNANKASTLERRLVRAADLLTTVSDEDRRSLGAALDDTRAIVLTPGYDGWSAPARRIDVGTPRRVILMGSFQWVVKRENLVRFLALADPVFRERGIELDVIGEVPVDLLPELRGRCRATRFHGFVTDVGPLFARARLGVVPECIGGGFKLKFLDYIFGRLPVATLSQAAAGLPPELRRTLLTDDSLDGLVRAIVSHIDRIEALNRMQERAFALAEERYRWSTRGEKLEQAIAEAQQRAARRSADEDGLPAPRVDLAVS
jgi:peptidoglycan/LPS O-acetylase OafA/YrhL/glycosyltransferase involved in cell wall biosynthesis